MVYAGRRKWRLFHWMGCLVLAVIPAVAQGPTLTTVADTVYRADGTPATGTLLI